MADVRILVTGSRTWRWTDLLRDALDAEAYGADAVTLVHGGAVGADRFAAEHASHRGWRPEAHPARWSASCRSGCRPGHRKHRRDGAEYCPAAGVYRNTDMVASGADVVVAFVRDHSAGTVDLVRRAQGAGIRVRELHDCRCHPAGALPALAAVDAPW